MFDIVFWIALFIVLKVVLEDIEISLCRIADSLERTEEITGVKKKK